MGLKEEEKIFLLQLVRKTLEAYFGRERLEVTPPPWPNISLPAGAFVTLHKDGTLRGCIGCFQSEKPLYQVVQEMALAAALNDPRFPPVSADELPKIEIEISVLSPLKKGKPEEVEIGKHGVYLVKGYFRGVLLPQVAVEQGWDRETFLDHVCLKAGLPPRCWQDPETQVYLFTAEVFSEKDLGIASSQKNYRMGTDE